MSRKYKYQNRSIPAINDLIIKYKIAAKNINVVFNISFDDFLRITSSNCFYCGSPPAYVIKKISGSSTYTYNGIDRLDSNMGYEKNNIVPCCAICNFAKSDHTYDEFISWVTRVGNNVENIKQKLIQMFPNLIIS